MKPNHLSPDLLYRIDTYRRAANYLSVGQMFLAGNPLLKRPLERTTLISPGAVDTELPSHISDKETAADVQKLCEGHAISADSFARAVVFAMSQPEDVDINEILFRPTSQNL